MNAPLHPIALATLLATAATHALAAVDYVDIRRDGIHVQDGIVVVEPVNDRYAKISTPEVSYHVEMKAGCKGVNQTLQQTFVAFGNANMNGDIVEANPGMPTVPVSARGNKDIGYTAAVLKVPAGQIGGALDPVQVCNTWLDQRKAQGASLMQIWTKDYSVLKPVTLSAVAECGGNTDYRTATLAHQLTVVCKAGQVGGGQGGIQAQVPQPPKPAGNFGHVTQVTNVKLTALDPEQTSTCPAKVKFRVEVSTDGPGTAQYLLRFPPNANTPEQSHGGQLSFDAAGSRTTPVIEFNAASGYPTGSAVVEIVSHGNKKAYASFKLQCVQAQGPGTIQQAPKPGDGGPKVLAPQGSGPLPPLKLQAAPVQPQAPLKLQALPQDPSSSPARKN